MAEIWRTLAFVPLVAPLALPQNPGLNARQGGYGQNSTGSEVGMERVVYCRGEFCALARKAAWLCGQGISATATDEGVVEWWATKAVDLDAIV